MHATILQPLLVSQLLLQELSQHLLQELLRSHSRAHAHAHAHAQDLSQVNVELWAKLARAAAGARVWPLALECAKMAAAVRYSGKVVHLACHVC
jgi:hypothetical protein